MTNISIKTTPFSTTVATIHTYRPAAKSIKRQEPPNHRIRRITYIQHQQPCKTPQMRSA